jgi:hypothetical protein
MFKQKSCVLTDFKTPKPKFSDFRIRKHLEDT